MEEIFLHIELYYVFYKKANFTNCHYIHETMFKWSEKEVKSNHKLPEGVSKRCRMNKEKPKKMKEPKPNTWSDAIEGINSHKLYYRFIAGPCSCTSIWKLIIITCSKFFYNNLSISPPNLFMKDLLSYVDKNSTLLPIFFYLHLCVPHLPFIWKFLDVLPKLFSVVVYHFFFFFLFVVGEVANDR